MNKTNAKKKGTVKTVRAKSLEDLQKVAVKIQADDPSYIPQCRGSVVVLKAKQGATLPHRATASIDCGFSITLPIGWKLSISALPAWASKGLIVTNSGSIPDGRVRVYLTNVGKEIIVINSLDEVAQMEINPLYVFDWVLNA